MWSTSSTFEATGVTPEQIWQRAYVDPRAWPRWNDAIASVEPGGPFTVGSRNRLRFRSDRGLRRRWFTLTEVEENRVFTDEGRFLGALLGHRHALEPIPDGVRLTNTLYLKGPLARVWAMLMARTVRPGLPRWQRQAVELSRE